MDELTSLEKLSNKVFKTVSEAAESLGDHVTGSAGLDGREEEQFLLPSHLIEALTGPMQDLGFPIEPKLGRVRDWSEKWHNFHQSRVKGGYIVFLYIKNKLLESGVHGNELAWIGMLFPQNGAKGIFIFSDSAMIQPPYETLAESWQDRQGILRAKFFAESYVRSLMTGDAESRKVNLRDWFKLDLFTSAAPPPAAGLTFEDLSNDNQTIEKIVEIIAVAAANAPGLTPQQYFNDLINRAILSDTWRRQLSGIWDGNVDATARKLVRWALSRKVNTVNQNYTTIAGLLQPLLDDVDHNNALFIFNLIQNYGLITDKAIVQKIQEESFGS